MDLQEISRKFGAAQGAIQGLQERSSRFASMLAAFCERLQWQDLEMLVSKFQARVLQGVRPELLALTEIPFVRVSQQGRGVGAWERRTFLLTPRKQPCGDVSLHNPRITSVDGSTETSMPTTAPSPTLGPPQNYTACKLYSAGLRSPDSIAALEDETLLIEILARGSTGR